jgi:hypothetical protein
MRNAEIMKNRAINEVECIKYRLAKYIEIPLYNDFVIIKHIIPKLPNDITLEMLTILKQFHDYIK